MKYDVVTPPKTKQASNVEPSPLNKLAEAQIPPPQLSTREYFYNKPPKSARDLKNIPPHVGLQAVTGEVLSIHKLEKDRLQGVFHELVNPIANPALPFSNTLTEADTTTVGTRYDTSSLPYHYLVISRSIKAALASANGLAVVDDLGSTDGLASTDDAAPAEDLSLSFKVSTKRTENISGEIEIAENGVILLRGISVVGTELEEYDAFVHLAKLTTKVDDILHDQGKWYLLPGVTPLTDAKFLSALRGYKEIKGFLAPGNDYQHTRDIENAFLVYIANRVQHVSDVIYTPTLDHTAKADVITHRGGGVLSIITGRHTAMVNVGQPPSHYEELRTLWLDRLPLDTIMRYLVANGFNVITTNTKQSFLIMSMPPNWAKSTMFKRSFIENNLGADVNFLNMAKSIYQGENNGKGSESLLNTHKYCAMFLDEFDKAIEAIKDNKTKLMAMDAMKEMGVSGQTVSGDSKGASNVKTIVPMPIALGASKYHSAVASLAARKELDSRIVMPATRQEDAATYFKGYNEEDTYQSLKWLVSELFYKHYTVALPMTQAERADWIRDVSFDEGDFNRAHIRAVNETRHLDILFSGCAYSFLQQGRILQTDAEMSLHDEVRPYDKGFAVRAPYIKDRGFKYLMYHIMNDQSDDMTHSIDEAKAQDKFNVVCRTDTHNCYTNGKDHFTCRLSLECDEAIMSMDYNKMVTKYVSDYAEDVAARNFLPLLDRVGSREAPSVIMNAVLVRLYAHHIDNEYVNTEVVEVKEDERF